MLISAKVIAHSKSSVNGKEIVTFELEYPRFIHSELMTHRLFSRNAASSRAIPVNKMIEAVRLSPAMPVHWGKNQPGMQANVEVGEATKAWAIQNWQWVAEQNANFAESMAGLNGDEWPYDPLHKQIVNRILEPFQWMKTVVTATEFDNWFWLRNHTDAQPEIKRLAECMWEALENSEPRKLHPGWWHVPYFHDGFWCPFMLDEDCYDDPHTLEEALAISSSCCAQVSYRKLDDSLEKALDIYTRLVESEPVHASPFEHQATPMKITSWDRNDDQDGNCWVKGITHMDKTGDLWSGNFKGFVQHRQLIPNNVCNAYTPL